MYYSLCAIKEGRNLTQRLDLNTAAREDVPSSVASAHAMKHDRQFLCNVRILQPDKVVITQSLSGCDICDHLKSDFYDRSHLERVNGAWTCIKLQREGGDENA